ncbi:hypothetical protein ACFRFH_06055 [Leifsonia sp. NPDC056824]|uniref:hypothetical protein n=1 Tax=Leifsonia sp. NPDC056824 TaxID=3345953 RepID=UPI003689D9DC
MDEQTQAVADPITDFTQAESLAPAAPVVPAAPAAPAPMSRRAALEAERAQARKTQAAAKAQAAPVAEPRAVAQAPQAAPEDGIASLFAETLAAEAPAAQSVAAESAVAASAVGRRGAAEQHTAPRKKKRVVRERVVIKPTRPSRAERRAAVQQSSVPAAQVAAGPSVADRTNPRHPRLGIYRKLHTEGRHRRGFHLFVLVALTAFFGTASLPAYATTGEASVGGAARTALAVQTLTGGNATAQVVSRDGLGIAESPQALDATTNSAVSPTVQALAVQLMGAVAAGRLVGSTPDHIPEIANLAEGKVVPNCGVDYRVLQAISVALDNFSQVGISDINRKCTGQIEGAGTDSAHYADGGGHAVDFFLLNGSALTGGDAKSLQLIRLLDPLVPKGSGLGQAECRGSISVQNFAPFDDTCNHVHIDFLKSQGATLKYG